MLVLLHCVPVPRPHGRQEGYALAPLLRREQLGEVQAVGVVQRLLREAQRRGLKLGVVSGGQPDVVDAVLRGAGLQVGGAARRGAARRGAARRGVCTQRAVPSQQRVPAAAASDE